MNRFPSASSVHWCSGPTLTLNHGNQRKRGLEETLPSVQIVEIKWKVAPGADYGQGLECVGEPGVSQSFHLSSELQPGVSLSRTQQT